MVDNLGNKQVTAVGNSERNLKHPLGKGQAPQRKWEQHLEAVHEEKQNEIDGIQVTMQ